MTALLFELEDRAQLIRSYERVRAQTEDLIRPLAIEDMVVQTMPDVSPTKWHLAHTSWFFEKLVLERIGADYTPFDQGFNALFNSYYQSLGDPFPRDKRGLLSRPTVNEIVAYRHHVDSVLKALLEEGDAATIRLLAPALTIGLNHEQQHQELLVMDAKHVLSHNSTPPVYRQQRTRPSVASSAPMEWLRFAGGRVHAGSGPNGFAFDNERPRHAHHLRPFELASRPVTSGEFQAFIEDRGYERPELWLADGWDLVQREGWSAPLYWELTEQGWTVFTLGGRQSIGPAEPVCHVSYFEADAYARWAGCRLPSEFEWEHATEEQPMTGTFLESGAFHPLPQAGESSQGSPAQLFGDVWEWTTSPYAPYPGYEPFDGHLGEYNGKFMINQLVLRGGSCITPRDHVRPTYRNFFYPHQRWMFAGFRLAR
ncbi:MAG: ergothioneine biosynthesis protein EgtB [Planctomycetota bacterium]|jgi:ergothioneine biosynthesis protein EgtB